ncbi:MAG: 2-hydroxyacyl-CoA dehydratase [Phycisphaeraceae bacterium]|nr:2-hydroxyacyl-CoA dehydratase [Phycisphaeraceae bacterium]
MGAPAVISLQQWDRRHGELCRAGMMEPSYGGPLGRHVQDGDLRLCELQFDNSPAALRLWNFLLSEEDRLHDARMAGKCIVGTMKDLGTVPVLAYALDNVVAFYPDGAWWTPCVMRHSDKLLRVADSLGLDESFCPVRAMAGAFVTGNHFPIPDMLLCSVGAVCDDFSAIAQRIEGLGHPIVWWEMPPRRSPAPGEPTVLLPTGFTVSPQQVAFVSRELRRVARALEQLTGQRLDATRLQRGFQQANKVRQTLHELRRLAYTVDPCPLPALEMLIAEMLAIHFCSDQPESLAVLEALLDEVQQRAQEGVGVLEKDAVRVFWINPVADLRVMNLLEKVGGRIAGSDYMFCHALEPIPQDLEPFEALARCALSDPMVGTVGDRGQRACQQAKDFGSEAVIISRIPGASHCAYEGDVIGKMIRRELGLPVLEIEVPPISDTVEPALRTRLEALMEIVHTRRRS